MSDAEQDIFDKLDARIGKRPVTDKPKKDDKPPKEDRTAESPKALREQLAKITGELKTRTEGMTALEKKIADYESKGKDTTALVDRLSAIEKERDDARAELRALKQEASPEFKDKYEKPFNSAVTYARNLIEQLQVGEFAEQEDGTRAWKAARPATWDDFCNLYSMPLAKASQAARQMFGDDSQAVIAQLQDLHRRAFERDEALKEEKARWKETESKQQAEDARRRELWAQATDKALKQLKEKYPSRYGELPEDKEGNEFLTEGMNMLEFKPKTMEEAARHWARTRMNSAAAIRAFHWAEVRAERIKELEAEIAELRNGAPGKVATPGAPSGEKKEVSWQEEMRSSVKG